MKFINLVIYKTALDYAKENNHQKIVDLLTEEIKQMSSPVHAKLRIQRKEFETQIQTQKDEFETKMQKQKDEFEKKKNEFENQMNQMKLMFEQMNLPTTPATGNNEKDDQKDSDKKD